jgi:hypothetical protein
MGSPLTCVWFTNLIIDLQDIYIYIYIYIYIDTKHIFFFSIRFCCNLRSSRQNHALDVHQPTKIMPSRQNYALEFSFRCTVFINQPTKNDLYLPLFLLVFHLNKVHHLPSVDVLPSKSQSWTQTSKNYKGKTTRPLE